MTSKPDLRRTLRTQRRAFVEALPENLANLVFSRPPRPLAALWDEANTIGLYHATAFEAPTQRYAEYFASEGKTLALPWFADRAAAMQFRQWNTDDELETGPFGMAQPLASGLLVEPVLLFVPILGFDAQRNRLGQGAGHYDRYLEAHPDVPTIGLAWSVQLCDTLPIEPHDIPLTAIITQSALYEQQDKAA